MIGLDLGNKPGIDFSKHKIAIDETTPSHLPPIPHPHQEGLHDDNNDNTCKLTNLHADLRKITKAQNYTTLRTNNTIYNTILRKS